MENENNLPAVHLELEKVDDRWAVKIRGKWFMFPIGTSESDARLAIARGIEIYKGRLN